MRQAAQDKDTVDIRKGQTVLDVNLGKGDLVKQRNERILAGELVEDEADEDLVDYSQPEEQEKVMAELEATRDGTFHCADLS